MSADNPGSYGPEAMSAALQISLPELARLVHVHQTVAIPHLDDNGAQRWTAEQIKRAVQRQFLGYDPSPLIINMRLTEACDAALTWAVIEEIRVRSLATDRKEGTP